MKTIQQILHYLRLQKRICALCEGSGVNPFDRPCRFCAGEGVR